MQWLSGRVLDSRPKGRGFEPHRCHCIVVLEQDIYPSLVLVQPRKTCPCLTERLLMGRRESNQTNKQKLNSNDGKKYSRLSYGACRLNALLLNLLIMRIYLPMLTFFQKHFFRNTSRVSNSLNPDQDRQNVGPDLGPNSLQR